MSPTSLANALRRLARDTRGASAVEFAIVSLPFLAMIFAILETAVVFYFTASLDQATQNFANGVRAGTIQLSSLTANSLKSAYLCPNLPGAMSCSNLAVSLQANTTCGVVDACWFASYDSDWTKWANGTRKSPSLTSSAVATGASNNTLYLTVAYPMPLLATIWSSVSSATINGQKVRAIVASAIFLNDPAVQH